MAENREMALVLKLVADNFQSELRKSGGMLGDFNRFISDWKTQLVAAGGALFAIAKSTANFGEEALKSSQRLGLTVEKTTALQYAASLADVPISTLEKGLKTLAQNAAEAARGAGDGAQLFTRLGLSATDTSGKVKPLDQLFFEFQDRLKGVTNQAQFLDAGTKAFGKTFLELVPIIKQGSAATKESMEEGRRFGVVMTDEQAEAADELNNELKKLQAQMRGITLTIGNELIPSFTTFFRIATESMGPAASWVVTETFKGLAEGITFANAELQAFIVNWNALSDKRKQPEFKGMIEEQRQLNLGDIYKQMNERLVGIRPEAFGIVAPIGSLTPGAATDGKTELAQVADQEKLGKKNVDIWRSNWESMDNARKIRARLADEEWERELERINVDADSREAARKEIDDRAKLAREAAAQERADVVENAQAWVAYYDQLGGNSQDFLAHKTELLRAQLAKELDLTKAQSADLLAAWQNRDSLLADQILADSPKSGAQKETLELNTMRANIQNLQQANGAFFDGWAQGMADYVKQTGNGFNMATDMARQTAQAMELGFRNFFFDIMDNKIKSLKDVFRSLLDFVKRIIAQITAQLITKGILNAISGGAGPAAQNYSSTNFFPAAAGGEVVKRYAMGGTVPGFGTSDTVPALLTPGEFVLSRDHLSDIKRVASGGNQVTNTNVINVYANGGGRQQESSTAAAPNFAQLARDLSKLVELKIIEEQRPGGLLA